MSIARRPTSLFNEVDVDPMTGRAPPLSQDEKIKSWLERFSFDYNPFEYVESERDAHLESYYISHPAYRSNIDLEHGVIYADSGIGKTATRLRIQLFFHDIFPTQRVLAVPHLIAPKDNLASIQTHAKRIFHLTVRCLFVCLAEFGSTLPQLQRPSVRSILVRLFDDMERDWPDWRVALASAGETGDLSEIYETLSIPFNPDIPPKAPVQWLARWHELLAQTDPVPVFARLQDPLADWLHLRSFLIGDIHIHDTVVLVDDRDQALSGRGHTRHDWMRRLIEPLLDAISSSSLGHHVWLKLFLPIDLTFPAATLKVTPHIITWTDDRLRKMLERRLEAASRGAIQYFDQLLAPDAQDVDRFYRLAEGSPRKLIQNARALVLKHINSRADFAQETTISNSLLQGFYRGETSNPTT